MSSNPWLMVSRPHGLMGATLNEGAFARRWCFASRAFRRCARLVEG
ncbi:hypothetical protein A7982_12041 [Minicystis rosea]|nr:hypothetical protein A7982_12041 [Minicystis rosea]